MDTIKLFSFIAISSWLHCVSASDCPPERFPTRRPDGSLAYPAPPSSDLADLQIVGGVEVNPNEFPFIISLQRRYGNSYYHICGGSIYDEKIIITAAHCVDGRLPSEFRVVAGEHDRFTASGDEQVIPVLTIDIHPNYNIYTLDNDIAVLELDSALTFNDKVGRIDLSTADPSAGTDVIVAGWGDTSYEGSSPDIMNKVTVNVISNSQCSVNYNALGYQITDNMICAGVTEGGKGSCQGDSGGPLFKTKTSTKKQPKTWWLFFPTTTTTTTTTTPAPRIEYEQVGIVSWGARCADSRYPGVYTRMSKYVSRVAGVAGAQS